MVILTGGGSMGAQVSVAQAKAGFAALVARAEAGEQIVVTRNGRPVACLGPLPVTTPAVFGDLRGLWISDDLSLPEEILNDFEEAAENFTKQLKEYDKKNNKSD